MNEDLQMHQFMIWVLTFLFSALVGILTWLGKSLLTKIDVIVKNQESDALERTVMKKDIDSIKTDVNTVKVEIKDIFDIKQKLVRIETIEAHIVEDVQMFKQTNIETQKKINELSERILRQENIINKNI